MASNTTYGSYNDGSLREYLMLENQKEQLRQRTSAHFSNTSPFSTSTLEWTSNQSTPMQSRGTYGFPSTYDSHSASAPIPTSHPIPTAPGLEHRATRHSISDLDQATEEGRTLYDINQQIKATLTELLNTDRVKHDDHFRAFVQSKLMEAEMELKGQRRRRSSEACSHGSYALASSIRCGLKFSV